MLDAPTGAAANIAVLLSDALSGTWLDRDWDHEAVQEFVAHAASRVGLPASDLRKQVALRILRDPELMEFPPGVAIRAQLERLLALAPLARVWLWSLDDDEQPRCLCAVGAADDDGEARSLALCALGGITLEGPSRLVYAPVLRWQQRHAVLMADPLEGEEEDCKLLVAEAASIIGPLIERERLLQRNAQKEHALVSASERALERLGLDLHDRPIQDVAALADDLRLFRDQLASVLDGQPKTSLVLGRVDDLEARLVELHRQLREMSHTLVSPTLLKRPLPALIDCEVAAFRDVSDIDIAVEMRGDLEELSVSQRVTILRIVQEALSNVREHGSARSVAISVSMHPTYVAASVVDDGRGFDVHETMVEAARRGRLGLVGMGERARLLGGTCEIHSSPGGPTRVDVCLPRWEAPVSDFAVAPVANGRGRRG